MNKFLSPTFLIALIVMGVLWLRSHDSQVRASALASHRADSIQALQAELDSLWDEFDSERATLLAQVDSLTGWSVSLAHELDLREQESQRLVGRVGEVLPSAPDSVQAIVRQALAALQVENQVCKGLLNNCEQRVVLLREQVARDTVLITIARQRTRELAEEVQRLLRKKARRPLLTVGATVGYGATLSGGTVYAGPSATVGLVFRFFSFGGG